MKILYLLSFSSLLLFAACSNDNTNNETAGEEQSLQQPEQQSNDSTALVKKEKLTYIQSYDRALSLWKTPFEEKDIRTKYGNAHVIISGAENAPPLVLLHGMNASSTMWYPNIIALSSQYRVYAVDFLLEPGKSLCNAEIEGTDAIVSWYMGIFDELGLKKFSIVGASRGGWLSINIALHAPSRINKIVLLSPAQTFTWIIPNPKILKNITYTLSPKRKKLRHVLETMTSNVDNISQVFINQYYIATREATVNKCMLQMTPFSEDELRSLKMPVLVLIGDKDIINGKKSMEKARRLIPGVQTEMISRAGHFLSIDQAEEVNKKVLAFLYTGTSLSVKK
ncbi:MAG TPA: alpha/beta hydrolase [Bacteroidia bacterium]|jgi:pimeloyl-ACP methyl ester carboxylesterase